MTVYKGWAYSTIGDYHRQLDPNWSYTPTYLRKMTVVREVLLAVPRNHSILDLGCGEGVLVEEFRHKGYDIHGLDLNYESQYVQRGDVLNIPYEDSSVDVVLLLDVFEHLAYSDQPRALIEIARVLKPQGTAIISVPNLAHLNSRFRMAFFGRLDRTDVETNHIGERPYIENRRLIQQHLQIVQVVGLTFTLPFLYRRLICRHPSKLLWLHNLQEPLARRLPSLAMLTIFIARKSADV